MINIRLFNLFTFENTIHKGKGQQVKKETSSSQSSQKSHNNIENDNGMDHFNTSAVDLKKFEQDENKLITEFEKKFGRLYKTFDVGYVKKSLWEAFKDTKKEDHSEKIGFQKVINRVSSIVSPNILDNLSTPTFFVCLLHLANEKSIY